MQPKYEWILITAVSKQQALAHQTSFLTNHMKLCPNTQGPGLVWSNKFIHSKQWLQEMISVETVPHPQLSRVNYVFH